LTRSPLTFRRVAALALVALVAGAITARADGNATPRPLSAAPVAPPVRMATAAAPPVAPSAVVPSALVPPPAPCVLQPAAKAAAPPSQALLDAFAVLRRERTDADALPAEALDALRQRGLDPVAPESARLLRTTASGGRAWVVPVPDVGLAGGFLCRGPIAKATWPAARRAARRRAARRRAQAAPPTAKPTPPTAKPTPTTTAPREGLAVVALGDAAPGGGGAFADLIRGRAPVFVDPCAGSGRDLLAVSGIVPDGVPAVFLTAPDGTAVRADVKDNGFQFVVPRTRTSEPRYVVWTGGDGTPHVQPVPFAGRLPRGLCRRLVARAIPRVTPSGFGACGALVALAVPRPVRPGRRHPGPLYFAAPCEVGVAVLAPPAVLPVAVPSTRPALPKAPRPVPKPR
jgi:hypothetical protein